MESRRKQEALEAEARAVKAKQDEAKLEKIKQQERDLLDTRS